MAIFSDSIRYANLLLLLSLVHLFIHFWSITILLMQIFLAKENDYVYSKNIIFLFICISKRFPDERAKLTVSLTEILPLIGRGVIIHEMPTIFFLQFFYSYLKSYSNTWVLLLVIFPTRKRNKNFKKSGEKPILLFYLIEHNSQVFYA